jgi:hypothetical protein
VEPAFALGRELLGKIEPLPGGLVNRVVGVDVPSGGEADEPVVEELDGRVAVERRTT